MKRIVRNLLAGLRRRTRGAACPPARSRRRLGCESLEDRRLLSAAPYGAYPDDTGEFMLGDVLVTVVFMESNANVSLVNPNTENWTPALISAAKQKLQTGVEWWEQTLATQFPASPHELNFHFDFTYADQPVLTSYEPISQSSDYFQYWMYDFLNPLGYNQGGSFTNDIRAFNHAQRLAHGTDWAYTLFVVNDTNDSDNKFAYGGSFQQAFSYAGGQFIVSPVSRPASTFAHETGHMFWARDEYAGGGSYSDRRGYYNTQNWNASDNPAPGFTQVVSIMRENPLDAAYNAYTSSPSSLAMIGWQDSDGDGIFDVLDVPHTLSGSGYLDPAAGQYRFVGSSSVQTLANRNPSGLQDDITLNKISRAEYRIDGGSWQTAAVYGTAVAELNLSFPVPTAGVHSVEIRTVDAVTGITSPTFHGDTSRPAVLNPGLSGFIWNDSDSDQTLDNSETRLSGWTVRLVDANGSPLNLVQTLEPDGYAAGTVLNSVHPQARLSVVGDAAGTVIAATYGTQKIFGNRSYQGTSPTWKQAGLGLRADFTAPVTTVRLDAIGTLTADRARLEAYDRFGTLLGRYTTGPLANGQSEVMQIQVPAAQIAYVIAEAHSGSAVRLDRLRWGPETAVTTNAQGAYAMPGLPAGDYFVEAVSSSGQVAANSRREVTLADGETLGSVNLIAQSGTVSWQNPGRPTDVNADGIVTALDALILINYINSHPGAAGLPAGEAPPPYLDVDGNSLITAADVLVVINQLNNAAVAAGGESSALTEVPSETPAVPTLARSASEWDAALSPPAVPTLARSASEWEPSLRVPMSDTPIKADSSGGLSPAEGEEPVAFASVQGWHSARPFPRSPGVPDAAAVQRRTNRAPADQRVSLDDALATILDGEDWLASD